MTDKEARRILLDIADQMPSDVCADWIDAISVGVKAIDTQMRDATEEERKSVRDYIESISKPTGVRFDTYLTDAKETIIKSALKYLVKRQIEEGSVGFAVDNDPDHDCSWNEVLAWLEAQSCEDCISVEPIQWYSQNKDGYLVRGAYSKDEAYVKLTDVYEKMRTSEDCISREAMLSLQTQYAEKMGTTTFWKLRDDIRKLPSVTPQRPRGEWIKVDDEEPIAYDCSECNTMVSKKYNYCPECGAEMEKER